MARNGVTVDKRVWNRMKRNLLAGNRKSLDIGWFDGKMHTNNRTNSPPVTLAQLASWLEHGHVNGGIGAGTVTPPRPFMRAGFIVYLRNNKDFANTVARHFTSVALGTSTWEQVYAQMGPQLVKALQAIMYAWNNPSNAPMTQSLKGFNDPLLETGELIAAVDWRVGTASKATGGALR